MSPAAPILPTARANAVLVGRVWDESSGGPRPVGVVENDVHDLFGLAPTVSGLLELDDVTSRVVDACRQPRWSLADLVDASLARHPHRSRLLAPVDLQVVKACGVTYVDSMIERVIEQRAAGDPARAADLRAAVTAALEGPAGTVAPGSAEARELKVVLLEQGLWSPYLEVGLGPDPEIFTKTPVLASVGYGAHVGVPAYSAWNNPEPELVLAVDSRGRIRGATLGNDVNLRDVEGRSALLLGMAKDHHASSALGPFIRLFDDAFPLDVVRQERIELRIQGTDGFTLSGDNSVGGMSRSFEELVAAAYGPHHQYPDGFVLYTGTSFTPTQDRDEPGSGFTHRVGDLVSISSPHLGTLTNEVARSDTIPPWEFGVRGLVDYLLQAVPHPERTP